MKAVSQVRDRSVVDAVIACVLLLVFVVAYAVAQSWERDARLVPQVVCVMGALSCILRLVQMTEGLLWHKRHPEVPHTHAVVSEVAEAADLEPEVVFARATLPEWTVVTAWCASFFVLLFVAGIYVAAAVFSLTYLVIEGRARTWQAALYAAVAVLLMYLVFDQLLTTPLPEGLLKF